MDLKAEALRWEPEVIAARRHLHQHPELSDREYETAQYLFDTLSACPALEVSRPCPTGVMAVLHGKKPGHIYAARADIDALPVTEVDASPYCSVNPGVMHACGHDGNTAMLLTAARILAEHPEEVSGTIKFIFQPCEEAAGGGSCEIVDSGVIDDVDLIFGAHVDAESDAGYLKLKNGPTHSAVYEMEIVIHGKGGHGGFPHQCIDSINVGAEIVCALNSVIAKNLDPLKSAVMTITQFEAAQANNIMPETVRLGGTLRVLNAEVEELLLQRIRTLCTGIAQAYGASCDVNLSKSFNLLYNDDTITDAVRELLGTTIGNDHMLGDLPVLGGEDFSLYLTKTKGCYFKIGTRKYREDGVNYPHHHARFYMDEAGLKTGVLAWLTILTGIEQQLKNKEISL